MIDKIEEEQFEYEGMIFKIHASPVCAHRQRTGKFAAIGTKGIGGCPVFQAIDYFDTAEEAISVGKAQFIAKLSERPPLWKRIVWPFGFVAGLLLVAGLMIALTSARAYYKLRHWRTS
jgi:hypothetical protein